MCIYIIYLTLFYFTGAPLIPVLWSPCLKINYYNIIIIIIITIIITIIIIIIIIITIIIIIIIIIIILRYDWEIADLPAMCICGDLFTVDHAMVCRHGGLIIQRHNEIRDLEAEMLRMVCTDVETEPVLQEITGEELNRGANKAPDAQLDVHARGFWDRQQSAFFDVRVCHPNADSYRELSPKQIFQLHENEKKRQYSRRVLEVEQGTFTPLVFTSTGGMADECKRFHSRLAELLALKKGDDYATTISWIRAKVSFAILRSALLCLRGTRSKRKAANISDIDITSESAQANNSLSYTRRMYNRVYILIFIFLNL